MKRRTEEKNWFGDRDVQAATEARKSLPACTGGGQTCVLLDLTSESLDFRNYDAGLGYFAPLRNFHTSLSHVIMPFSILTEC